MSKSLRFSAALGAVLFALLGLAACGGHTRQRRRAGRRHADHKRRVQSLDGRGRLLRRRTTGGKPVVPVPPNYSACIAHLAGHLARNRPKVRKLPPTPQLKSQCERSTNRSAGGARLPDLLLLGDRRSQIARCQVDRQGSPQAVRKNQAPAVPESRPNSKNSWRPPGQIGLRPAAAREAEPALAENPAEDRQSTKRKSPQAQIQKYYNENKSRYGTPEKRNVEIILTKTEAAAKSAKKEIESGKSFCERRQEGLDRPDQQGQGRSAGRSDQRRRGEVARRRDLLGQAEAAERPGQDAVRLLRLRGPEHQAGAPGTALEGQDAIKAAAASQASSRRR